MARNDFTVSAEEKDSKRKPECEGQGKALGPVFEDVFNELAQLYQMDPDEKHRSSSMLLLNLITQYITDKEADNWIKSDLEKMSKADLNVMSKVLSNLITEKIGKASAEKQVSLKIEIKCCKSGMGFEMTNDHLLSGHIYCDQATVQTNIGDSPGILSFA